MRWCTLTYFRIVPPRSLSRIPTCTARHHTIYYSEYYTFDIKRKLRTIAFKCAYSLILHMGHVWDRVRQRRRFHMTQEKYYKWWCCCKLHECYQTFLAFYVVSRATWRKQRNTNSRKQYKSTYCCSKPPKEYKHRGAGMRTFPCMRPPCFESHSRWCRVFIRTQRDQTLQKPGNDISRTLALTNLSSMSSSSSSKAAAPPPLPPLVVPNGDINMLVLPTTAV